jgi:glycosyltransferase involved in cell wall biosynthesis
MPKVSVIVPVYQAEQYLEHCINSLINQTFQDLEIILVDDGSKDNSPQICDYYTNIDNRIKVIHQKNAGVSIARNNGIKLSHGEFITFQDADDYSEDDRIEIQYDNAINVDADISIVGLFIEYSAKNRREVYGTDNIMVWENNLLPLKYTFQETVFSAYPNAMLIRSSICKEVLFAEDRFINEDRFFAFKALTKARRVCFQDSCKYHYVQHINSVSHGKFNIKFLDGLYFAELMQQYAEENKEELVDIAKLNTCRTYINIYKYVLKDSKCYKEYRTERKKMSEKIKSYPIKFRFNNFSIIRFVDSFFMSEFPFIYSVLIRTWSKLNQKE